jgi:hypothetical protein
LRTSQGPETPSKSTATTGPEARRAAQELALFKHSLDVQRHGAYWFDVDDRLIWVNDAGRAMLGYARGRGATLPTLQAPEDPPNLSIRRCFASGSLTSERVRIH